MESKTPTDEGWRIVCKRSCLDLMVGRGGLEPPTNGLKVRCSTN
jgi:hypothetical protein